MIPSPHVLTTRTSASRSRKTVDPGSALGSSESAPNSRPVSAASQQGHLRWIVDHTDPLVDIAELQHTFDMPARTYEHH